MHAHEFMMQPLAPVLGGLQIWIQYPVKWYPLHSAALLLLAQMREVLQNTHDLIYYLRNSSILGLKTILYVFYSQELDAFTA